MAVISVDEQWEGRGASSDEQGVETRTRRWVVETDNVATTESDVIAAVPVAKYAQHPTSRAIARVLSCKPHESPTSWMVEIEYSSAPFRANSGGPPTAIDPASPTKPTAAQNNTAAANLRLPEFRFRRKEVMESAEFDAAGSPVLNSAGDPFEGVMIHRDRLVIEIRYWSIKITHDHVRNYWNAVNEDAYFGFQPKTLLVTEFDFQSVYETMEHGGQTFIATMYEVNVALEYRPSTLGDWRLKVLNQGLRQRIGGGKPEHILDRAGSEISTPVPLDATGEALPPYGNGSGAAFYKFFDMYPAKPFNSAAGPPAVPGLII